GGGALDLLTAGIDYHRSDLMAAPVNVVHRQLMYLGTGTGHAGLAELPVDGYLQQMAAAERWFGDHGQGEITLVTATRSVVGRVGDHQALVDRAAGPVTLRIATARYRGRRSGLHHIGGFEFYGAGTRAGLVVVHPIAVGIGPGIDLGAGRTGQQQAQAKRGPS